MKVLLINGSPRREGNTFIALSEAARACSKIRQVSCAGIIGETLARIARGESVSDLFAE